MRPLLLPNCPRAVLDARALIVDPERAARLPASVRTMAWRILANAYGRKAMRAPRHRTHLPEGM